MTLHEWYGLLLVVLDPVGLQVAWEQVPLLAELVRAMPDLAITCFEDGSCRIDTLR